LRSCRGAISATWFGTTCWAGFEAAKHSVGRTANEQADGAVAGEAAGRQPAWTAVVPACSVWTARHVLRTGGSNRTGGWTQHDWP
jgi:hypothetical protein